MSIYYILIMKKKVGILNYESFGLYLNCSFRATISQKSTYLIRHYAISGFLLNPSVNCPPNIE